MTDGSLRIMEPVDMTCGSCLLSMYSGYLLISIIDDCESCLAKFKWRIKGD